MNAVIPSNVEILRREELLTETQLAMFQLLQNNFRGVTLGQFEKDLLEKNWVILLKQNEQIVGFSTLLLYETRFQNETLTVVYSGDTIVAQEAWGSLSLAKAWIATVKELRLHHPDGRYYWLLLTSGFRTYRFLPVFWREFYPVYTQRTPASTQAIIDHLAQERFGSIYQNGVVRFPNPQVLAPRLMEVPEGRDKDPHVMFFFQSNPGWRRGDELVSLTELTDENLTAAGQRVAFPR